MMLFFLLFAYILVVIAVAFVQRSCKPSRKHTIIVSAPEDPNKIVYYFKHQRNPREYYLAKQRELLEAIEAEYSKKKGWSYSNWRD